MTSVISLAGCVITNNKNEILLIHRSTPNRTQWELPGGKIEPKESPEQTALRELEEELGIQVEIVRKLGEKTFNEDGYTMNYHWFKANIVKGTPSLTESKFDQIKYWSWQEMEEMKIYLSSNTKNLLNQYNQGNIRP